ncbi:MAG: hypothetical protein HQM00_02250 [Magnetococcales bacterium]|nr:hypothetical protein [Magnetococcales bacterium]
MMDDVDYSMPKEDTPVEELADEEWLALADAAWSASKDWMATNLQHRWERSIANFQSKHPPGSKYHTETYRRGRSRLFRPKSRSAVRQNEASAAKAFFSTSDDVHIEAENKNDPHQLASAQFMQSLVNCRLDRTLKWFLILIGAFQDAHIYGICASKQTWEYREEEETFLVPVRDPITGQPTINAAGKPEMEEQTRVKVVQDRPRIDLLRPGNVRIAPESDWTDPINSSPYLVLIIPMFVHEVQERMKTGKWREYEMDEILQSIEELNDDDTVDAMRRRDEIRKGDHKPLKAYSVVHVHENFLRRDGKDWVFMTLGKSFLLTDPKEAREVYPYAGRPVTLGYCVLETHNAFPAGLVELGWEIQAALNDVQNQRFDNVQLAMNGRFLARRSGGTDTASLVKNIPGSVTYTNDPAGDVVPLQTRDVTASAYQEQNLLNNDLDDIFGSFSQSSVNTNRRLNETVGGLQMLSEDSSEMVEYVLRTFSETWVEPTLRQLLKMEQTYESDAMIMQFAGRKAPLVQQYGLNDQLDAMLDASVTVKCKVGTGATKTTQKLESLVQGLTIIANTTGIRPNPKEVIAEVMGLLGYEDGERFFPDPNQPPPAPPPDPKMDLERERMALEDKQKEIQAQLQAMEIANRRDAKLLDATLKHRAQMGTAMTRIGGGNMA